jgi:hypothetical protein
MRTLATASEPSHRGGTFTLTVQQTPRGHFVVSLVKYHPTKAGQCRTFCWTHTTLEDVICSLHPGNLTNQVLEQLAHASEPA